MRDRLVAYVLRHGQTALNASNCFRSWNDPALDKTGLEQAREARDFLKDKNLRHVISSPLLRAFVTADVAAGPHKLQVYQHRGLFPWRLGVFSGLRREGNNDALRLFVENAHVTVPNGESLLDFEARQFAFWKAALEMARVDGLTLYVAHTSNLVALESFTSEDGRRVEPELGSETVNPGGIAAIYWNGKSHRVDPVFGMVEVAKFGGS